MASQWPALRCNDMGEQRTFLERQQGSWGIWGCHQGRSLKATARTPDFTLRTGREATQSMVWRGALEGLS